MTKTRVFKEILIGDTAVFEHVFNAEAFEAFAELSGDRNPLHFDANYAAASEFKRPIVPLHMTIAPLSRVAGMIFPGEPSLYLGHELRSIRPVFYSDKLTYSARVIARNLALRTLTIRVLGLRGSEVVLDAEMRVSSRFHSWPVKTDVPSFSPLPEAAFVTGATGEIGTALTVGLLRRGFNLVLHDRGPGPRREALQAVVYPLLREGQEVEFVSADLCSPEDVGELCGLLEQRRDISLLIHTASPPLDAPVDSLVAVNYSALKQLAFSVAPGMLARQFGLVTAVGSLATERVIPGWWDYAAVKGMQAQFIAAFDRSYSEFGLRGLEIISGLVDTAYSRDHVSGTPAMLAEELAEAVLAAALDGHARQAMIVEGNRQLRGVYGFSATHSQESQEGGVMSDETVGVRAPEERSFKVTSNVVPSIEETIASTLRGKLRLAQEIALAGGGVGLTPGWDSLRQIELVLELEAIFGVQFAAEDVVKMLNYESLVETVTARVARR